MKHATLIEQLKLELASYASEEFAQSMQRYFPDKLLALGVSNDRVAKIASAAIARHPRLLADEWLELADHFAHLHQYHEYLMLASAIAAKIARRIDDEGRMLDRIKGWLECHVRNWAQCDDLCIKPIYVYVKQRPQLLINLYQWGESTSPWCRRASNVAMVKFVGRTNEFDIERALNNCERLLNDDDSYVQKGIGWFLKVAVQYEPEVINFIARNKTVMQRKTLLYAVEKLPAEIRCSLMSISSDVRHKNGEMK